MSTVACDVCGAANPSTFRFCGSCGSALGAACAVCGAAIPAGNRFCGTCGTPIGSAAAPAAPQAPEERKLVTALFADIAASTQMAARLDPEDLRAILKPFFDAMAEEIARFGGTIEKYIGDAVCAFFGAPVAHEDDPERAVRAGLAMLSRLENLNRDLQEPLHIRIGIHTGEVVTIPGGPAEGIATGGPINVAARLQSAAAPGTVLVGERTRRDCRDVFAFREIEPLTLKGIDEPVRAWTVTGTAAGAGHRRDRPMVGRAEELTLLRILLDRTAREGRANLATIVGPAGIGKSRLARELTRVADGAGVRVHRGRCPPYGDGLTYWPLGEALKADAGIYDTDQASTISAKAAERLRALLPGQEQTIRLLLGSLGLFSDADPLAGVDADTARGYIARAWRTYLEALAAASPILLVIEDVHWADPSLLDLVESLAARITSPVMIACTSRPDLWERRRAWAGGLRNATTIELSGLSPDHTAALVTGILPDAPTEAVAAILERAEGNPFFAQELVQMLVEEGVLASHNGRWRLERPMPAALPDTVQAVIASRIDRLEPEEKAVIQAAAVVGRVFWPGAVERIGAGSIPAAVDGLIAKGLVLERETSVMHGQAELIFNHILTRDVAYGSIPRARRAQAHAAVGLWMEETHADRPDEFAEVLAHHFSNAGDRSRTARYAALAGHRRRRVFAADDAIRWYDRAEEAAGPAADSGFVAEVARARAEAWEQTGRFPEAQLDYERALAASRAAGDPVAIARALAGLAHIYWLQDRYEDGRSILAEALDAARAAGHSELLARTLYTAGTMAFGHGDRERALDFHDEALSVAASAGDLLGQALAHHGLCETRYFLGPYEQAGHDGLRAAELARAIGDRVLEFHNEYMTAYCFWLTGRHDDAVSSAARAIEGNRDLGARRDEAFSLTCMSVLRLSSGELGASLALASQALRIATGVRSPRLELVARGSILDVLVELNDVDAAEAGLDECDRLAASFSGSFFRARLLACRGWTLARRGHVAQARAAFSRALEEADSPTERHWVDLLAIQAWTAAGEPGDLAAVSARMLGETQQDVPRFRVWAMYGTAAALEPSAQAEGAAAEAIGLADRIGERRLAWRARAVRAAALDALGRAGAAAAERADAASLARACAGTIHDPEQAARFEQQPVVAALLGT